LTEPDVVLMDEPTSALDHDNRDVIEGLTRVLADSGIAVIWVTHDLDQAHRLATEIVVLVTGKVATEAEAAAFVDADERPNQEGDDPDAGN
jgi:ABC-type molybdate transport system ATPase subunit